MMARGEPLWTALSDPVVDGGRDEIEVRQLYELEDLAPSPAIERFQAMELNDKIDG